MKNVFLIGLFLVSAGFLMAAAPSPGKAPSSRPLFKPLAAQALSETSTILADSCGGVKLLTSTGAFTTNTTNTITAPNAGLNGCEMTLVNVGDFTLLLDSNVLFFSSAAVSYALGASDTYRVATDGNFWFQTGGQNN